MGCPFGYSGALAGPGQLPAPGMDAVEQGPCSCGPQGAAHYGGSMACRQVGRGRRADPDQTLHPSGRRIRPDVKGVASDLRGGTRLRCGTAGPGRAGRAGSGGAVGVGGEALAAAALGRRARIGEDELVVQALAHEVDGGAVDHRLAAGVDVDAHAVLLADAVALARLLRKLDLVSPARAAGLPDAETQPECIRTGGEELADAFEGGGGELDGHDRILARGG